MQKLMVTQDSTQPKNIKKCCLFLWDPCLIACLPLVLGFTSKTSTTPNQTDRGYTTSRPHRYDQNTSQPTVYQSTARTSVTWQSPMDSVELLVGIYKNVTNLSPKKIGSYKREILRSTKKMNFIIFGLN